MTIGLQSQDNDCGIQALIASLRLGGHEYPEHELRGALSARGGLSLRDLRDTANEVCGVRLFAKRDTPFDDLRSGTIVHLRSAHFVTVDKRRGRKVRVFDPARGYVTYKADEYATRSSGWVLHPPAEPGPMAPQRPQRVAWLRPLLAGGGIRLRHMLPVLLVSLIVYGGLSLLNVFLTPYLDGVVAESGGWQYAPALALLGFVLVLSAVLWHRHRHLTRLGLRFDRQLLSLLVHRLTETSATTQMTSGAILHRMTSVRELREAGMGLVVGIFTDFCSIIVLLAFMVRMSPALSGIVAILALAQVGLAVLAQRPIRRHYDARMRLEEAEQDVLITLARGLSTFRGLGAVAHLRAEHARRLEELTEVIRTIQYQMSWVSAPLDALRFVNVFAILVAGSILVSTGVVTTGELFGFLTLGGTLLFSVGNIVESVPATAQLMRHVRFVTTLLDMPLVPRGRRARGYLDAPAVVLDDVRVNHAANQYRLRLDVTIERGETVTIGGVSGAGKSTLGRIATGLDPAPSGTAEIFGVPLGEWDPDRLRPLACYVPVRSDFLHTSMLDSLSSGDATVTEEEVMAVLDRLELGHVVRGLRLGLATKLRIDGSTFSAGEVQRFAIARALLRRPTMVVLDEATGSLDREMELRVLSTVQQEVQTLIIISHRPVAAHLSSRHLVLTRDAEGIFGLVQTDG